MLEIPKGIEPVQVRYGAEALTDEELSDFLSELTQLFGPVQAKQVEFPSLRPWPTPEPAAIPPAALDLLLDVALLGLLHLAAVEAYRKFFRAVYTVWKRLRDRERDRPQAFDLPLTVAVDLHATTIHFCFPRELTEEAFNSALTGLIRLAPVLKAIRLALKFGMRQTALSYQPASQGWEPTYEIPDEIVWRMYADQKPPQYFYPDT